MGPQVQPGNLLQGRLPAGSHTPSATSTCPSVGPSVGCKGTAASPWSSPWAGAWSTSSLSCTDLGVYRAATLTQFHSSPAIAVVQNLSPVLKYDNPAALPPSLTGSALASGSSILKPAGTGSVGHKEKLLAAAHRSHPCTLVVPCYANPAQKLSDEHKEWLTATAKMEVELNTTGTTVETVNQQQQ